MKRTRIDEDRADLFTCVGCKRRVPAAFGCDDNMPNHCDDCWVHAHGFARTFITPHGTHGLTSDEQYAVSLRCCYCGETLPLGPASDRIPADELELAESIAWVEDMCDVLQSPPSDFDSADALAAVAAAEVRHG